MSRRGSLSCPARCVCAGCVEADWGWWEREGGGGEYRQLPVHVHGLRRASGLREPVSEHRNLAPPQTPDHDGPRQPIHGNSSRSRAPLLRSSSTLPEQGSHSAHMNVVLRPLRNAPHRLPCLPRVPFLRNLSTTLIGINFDARTFRPVSTLCRSDSTRPFRRSGRVASILRVIPPIARDVRDARDSEVQETLQVWKEHRQAEQDPLERRSC